ncbi:MAG TPA: thioredoxin domain-containing protein [Bdellovibrionota bacterium]|nr:thioredoxin domain-containing protein [Bdellovibrionota bacterium]
MTRTRHHHADGTPKFTNRLALESSPYLLQHAHNPVDWYPWGDEAFERARKEGRPVLLSIGYATCHWCHVMEEESFEDLEIAGFINHHYVPIKVDREQRPDVDAVYMNAVQTLTGGGGWPMTMWLTPDKKPFYGGTYFPSRDGDRGARMGFLSLLQRLYQVYRDQPDHVAEQASELSKAVAAQIAPEPGGAVPGVAVLHEAFRWFAGQYDPSLGGWGHAPKFPRPVSIEFLFHYGVRANEPKAIEMALHTLRMMGRGGMYDQLAGGFHRYSVDPHWLVPHFEKMLYDNAQLVIAYLEAFQLTGEKEFERIARETLDYVSREMTDSEGGFYSATDADSEGKEGKFFLWSKAEIFEHLGKENGEIFCEYYDVTERGNFEGHNILHIGIPLHEVAAKKGRSEAEALRSLEESRTKLYRIRKKRIPPLTDDKILTAWNGLMIGAFARGGFVLAEPKYIVQGKRAAEFVLERLMENGRLLRSCRRGKAQMNGFLDDYTFLIFGLLELFEASGEVRWLKEGIALQEYLLSHFWDEMNGGFFMTSRDHETLIAREKPYYDGAEPAGNSVAALNLLRLESFATEARYGEHARKVLQAMSRILENAPHVAPLLLTVLDYHYDLPKEILIVSSSTGALDNPLIDRLRKTYIPNRVIANTEEGQRQSDLGKIVPWSRNRTTEGKRAMAYVCEKQICSLPTSEPEVFSKQLAKIRPLENK